ncbi:MAG: sensor histidine kinase [Spirochaetales bacterium]|nr:sensor histidine kinase [Spirochaetales bacterium]
MAVGIGRLTDHPFTFAFHWLSGAGMVCAMFWALFRAAWREILRRKAHLEEQIRLRTEALEKALEQSEALQKRNAMLLKEIHHRTKNNLQIVASLLSLQRGNQDTEKSVDEILDEAERRVRTMAKTHEMFHNEDGSSIVGVEQFVKAITESYLRSGLITSLYIETDAIKGVAVEMDVAIPLGLIINELFSNVVQHAYAEDLPERPIWVFLTYREGWLTATVEDHGIGIPESIDIDRLDSGGLRIVKALADQINASLSLCRNPFTTWIIRTPVVAATYVGDVGA